MVRIPCLRIETWGHPDMISSEWIVSHVSKARRGHPTAPSKGLWFDYERFSELTCKRPNGIDRPFFYASSSFSLPMIRPKKAMPGFAHRSQRNNARCSQRTPKAAMEMTRCGKGGKPKCRLSALPTPLGNPFRISHIPTSTEATMFYLKTGRRRNPKR